MKHKPNLILNLLLFVSVVGFITGCSGAGQPIQTKTPDIPPVKAIIGTVAEAAVVPIKHVTLSFPSPGIVTEMLAPEGARVKAGDVIARQKGSERLQASMAAAELELLSAQQALDTLNRNAAEARAAAQLRLAEAEKRLDKAKTNRENKQYTVGSRDQIDLARAEFVLAQENVRKAEELLVGFSERPEDDITRASIQATVGQARQIRDRAQRNLNYLLGKPDPLDVNIAEGELRVAQAAVDAATRDLEKLSKGPDPDQVALIQARIRNAQAQLSAAKAALADLQLVSPIDGVVAANNLKVGEFANPGVSNVVVADTSVWQVETTDLTEMNVVKFEPGAPVKVNFDAISDLEINGKIERIKLIGQNKQGDITYTVVISLEKQDPRLRWNMTATATFEK